MCRTVAMKVRSEAESRRVRTLSLCTSIRLCQEICSVLSRPTEGCHFFTGAATAPRLLAGLQRVLERSVYNYCATSFGCSGMELCGVDRVGTSDRFSQLWPGKRRRRCFKVLGREKLLASESLALDLCRDSGSNPVWQRPDTRLIFGFT